MIRDSSWNKRLISLLSSSFSYQFNFYPLSTPSLVLTDLYPLLFLVFTLLLAYTLLLPSLFRGGVNVLCHLLSIVPHILFLGKLGCSQFYNLEGSNSNGQNLDQVIYLKAFGDDSKLLDILTVLADLIWRHISSEVSSSFLFGSTKSADCLQSQGYGDIL